MNKLYESCKVIHSEHFTARSGDSYFRLYALTPTGVIYPVVCPCDSPHTTAEYIDILTYQKRNEKTGVNYTRACIPRYRA